MASGDGQLCETPAAQALRAASIKTKQTLDVTHHELGLTAMSTAALRPTTRQRARLHPAVATSTFIAGWRIFPLGTIHSLLK